MPRPPLPALPPLPPLLGALPGSRGRRRAVVVAAVAGGVWLLRPWPPFQWLPGSVVGLLLLWAVGEGLRWLWRPRRWD
ncbi:MAG: hypothetical protein ACK5QW_05685 [Cyanobacteriota bacterium]